MFFFFFWKPILAAKWSFNTIQMKKEKTQELKMKEEGGEKCVGRSERTYITAVCQAVT